VYDQTAVGLFSSFAMGLPFFANSLMASVLFSLSFFLIYKAYGSQKEVLN
jgi:hypothetical protein